MTFDSTIACISDRDPARKNRSRNLRVAHWALVALFAAWAILALRDYDETWGEWQSPVTGLLAALVAIIAAIVGIRGRTALRLLVPALLVTGGLAVWIRAENLKRADYIVGARGIVVGATGEPISEADVTVRFAKNVFEAIDPVRMARTTTDPGGRFGFSYIACGDPHVPLELTIEKPGYRSASVRSEGFAHRRIVLERLP